MTFGAVISDGLPKGMSLPAEFAALFDWMESVGGVGRNVRDKPIGVVNPIELTRKGGSAAYFHEPFSDNNWTGCWDEREMSRLSTFMRTGWDGSSAAFWLDDEGSQHIVHLGSGSGSIMTGIWVRSPIDLMRLLAIGYIDLCWPEDYDRTPAETDDGADFMAPTAYRYWLASTFDVSIPRTASEVVGPMSRIGEDTGDPFCRWLASLEERGLTKR